MLALGGGHLEGCHGGSMLPQFSAPLNPRHELVLRSYLWALSLKKLGVMVRMISLPHPRVFFFWDCLQNQKNSASWHHFQAFTRICSRHDMPWNMRWSPPWLLQPLGACLFVHIYMYLTLHHPCWVHLGASTRVEACERQIQWFRRAYFHVCVFSSCAFLHPCTSAHAQVMVAKCVYDNNTGRGKLMPQKK